MILADTSVWADHLRKSDPRVSELLRHDVMLMHPFILGELALGYMPKRLETLESLADMPSVHVADPDEVLFLIEQKSLVAIGIGYVDTHLLASTLTTRDCLLWTRDKRLAAVASRLGVASEPLL